jgi:hypothetical protein
VLEIVNGGGKVLIGEFLFISDLGILVIGVGGRRLGFIIM